MRSFLAFLLATSAGFAGAVELAADGTGQVLIYPYYTARAGEDRNSDQGLETAFSVHNGTDRPKALKLFVRDGIVGDVTLSFNLSTCLPSTVGPRCSRAGPASRRRAW